MSRRELVLSVLSGYKTALEADNKLFMENIDYDLLRNNIHYKYTDMQIKCYEMNHKSAKRLENLDNLFYIAENGLDAQFINVVYDDINNESEAMPNPLSACDFVQLNKDICKFLDTEPVLYLQV